MKVFTQTHLIVKLWVLGFIGSSIIQFFFQEWFAAQGVWDLHTGWQTEIAILSFGLVMVLIPVSRDHVASLRVLPGLVATSLFISANHGFAAYSSDQFPIGNALVIGINMIAAVIGFLTLKKSYYR